MLHQCGDASHEIHLRCALYQQIHGLAGIKAAVCELSDEH